MQLPLYQAVNFETQHFPSVLTQPARKLSFPLSEADRQDIQILEMKFDQEENCAGLAGPQIGIAKQMIVFAAPENPELKEKRPDFNQTMEKTIWINPSYEAIGTEQHEDYEACFSVLKRAGLVKRYAKIRYKAYTPEGEMQEGIAEGFLARIIQHETDHINGKLFIDYVAPDTLIEI